MTPEEFAEQTGVPRGTLDRLRTYHALLVKWQRAVNLVGPRTLEDAWRRHFFDSAQLWPLVASQIAGRTSSALIDLGSGAGFPGLVLAVIASDAAPSLSVHLVESDQRKAAFLQDVARATKTAVTVHVLRAEALGRSGIVKADIVTARALAPVDELLDLAEPFLSSSGICLFLKGAAVDAELTRAGETWKMTVERVPSRTDSAGTILRIQDFGRV